MKVSLPVVHAESPQTDGPADTASTGDGGNSAEGNPVDGGDGKKNNGRHTTNILLALILGILVGGIIWFVWQQKEKNDEQARMEFKEARKAHQDSLMALRNQQTAEEEAAQKAQQDQDAVTTFLDEFYQQWFSDGDMSGFANNLSEQCFEKLHDTIDDFADSTSTDTDDGDDIDWQQLCPQMGRDSRKGREPGAIRINVTHDDGNWYRVRFISDKATEYRQIEAIVQNGKVIINDYR